MLHHILCPLYTIHRPWKHILTMTFFAQVMESKGNSVADNPAAIADFLNDSRRNKIQRLVDSYVSREGIGGGAP